MAKSLLKVLAASALLASQVLTLAAQDVPIRYQRREVFRACDVDSQTVVFLGNSITHFGVWPEMFGTDVKVVNRGISGNISGEVADHLDFVIDGGPKKLFLMIGTNDYAQREVIVPNIRRIIRTVKRESPKTEIYIESILPCNRDERKGLAETQNELLKQLCKDEGVTYIDVYSKVVDGNTANPGLKAEYTNDRLHVLGAGYRAWTSDFEQYVGTKPVFTNGNATQLNALHTVANMLFTQFQLLPVPDGAMLHIGDYNVKTGEWAELMHNTKFLNRGMGLGRGYTLSLTQLQASIPYIVKGKPSKIFVQCGARDWANSTTTSDWFFTNYTKAIEEIHKLAPDADVYMESVIPFAPGAQGLYTGATPQAINAKMEECHKRLKEWAEHQTSGKIHFVDVYGALAENGLLAEKYRGANTQQSWGINGRGYVRWANVLNDVSGKTMTPQPELTDKQFALREAISEALRTKYAAQPDTVPGSYSLESIRIFGTAIAQAKAVLAKQGATDAELTQAVTALTAAQTKMSEGITLPKASDDKSVTWYQLSTPNRDNKYLQAAGAGQAATGQAVGTDKNQQWKFVSRTDGTYDIVSALDNSYLNTATAANANITTVATRPAKGWKLSGVGASGYFIITAEGGVQLHQANNSRKYEIINWGSGTNTTDDGCLYKIMPVSTPTVNPDQPEQPAELKPLLTLTDITLDGKRPYKVPEAAAKPVLDASSVTVAVDFSLAEESANAACLFGASDSTAAEKFFGVLTALNTKTGKSYMAARFNNGGGVYSSNLNTTFGTSRQQLVVVLQPTAPSYTYYLGGVKQTAVNYANTTLHTVAGANGLWLGGLVCSDNANKYPAKATIHSIRFYSGVLTDEQIAAIDYNKVTGIDTLPAAGRAAASAKVYDLRGRYVGTAGTVRLQPGVYIIGGQKVVVK